MGWILPCLVGVVSLASFGQAQPDVADVLDALRSAHASGIAYEVESIIPGGPADQLGGEDRAILEGSSRIRWMEHPISGERVFVFADCREIADGSGQVRVELRHATTLGPPDHSTEVQLWGKEHWAETKMIGAGAVSLHTLDTPSADEMVAQKKNGYTPYAETRSSAGYLPAVGFVQHVLGGMADTRVAEVSGATATLRSDRYGLWADINIESGELESFTLIHKWGCRRTWFVGRFDEALFPARHPQERRGVVLRGEPPERLRDAIDSDRTGVRLYVRARRIPEPEPAIFEWTSLAASANDLEQGKIIRADGSVDEEATAAMLTRSNARSIEVSAVEIQPDGGVKPARRGWSGARRVVLSLSLAAVAVGAVIWFRRRVA